MRRLLRHLRPALIGGVLVSLLAIGSVHAAPIFDATSFSDNQTIITFDEVPINTPITTQFSGLGVTFSTEPGKQFTAKNSAFGVIWPVSGSGPPVANNFQRGVTPVTAVFDPPVSRVGFDVYSNDPDFVQLQAFLNGVPVGAHVFDTQKTTATFVGLEVPGGFDTLVITAFGPTTGSHIFGLDDFRFEGTSNQPPEAFAALEPIDVDEDEGTFRVVASGTDLDGNLESVVAVIKTPSIEGLDVELDVDDEVKIKFDLEEGEVKISGPDPQALLEQILELGGIAVPNGQIVEIESQDDAEEAEYEFGDGVLEIEASEVTLCVIATDTAGETDTALAQPVFEPSDEEENEGDEEEPEDEDEDDDED